MVSNGCFSIVMLVSVVYNQSVLRNQLLIMLHPSSIHNHLHHNIHPIHHIHPKKVVGGIYNPPIGSIYHLYIYIYIIYILPSGWLYATYRLLWKPKTTN